MFGYKWPISVPKSQVTKNKRTMHQKNHLIVQKRLQQCHDQNFLKTSSRETPQVGMAYNMNASTQTFRQKKSKSLRSIDNVWKRVRCTQSFLYIPFSFFFLNATGCKLISSKRKGCNIGQFSSQKFLKKGSPSHNQNSKSHIFTLNQKKTI